MLMLQLLKIFRLGIQWYNTERVPMRHTHETGFHTFTNHLTPFSVRYIRSETHKNLSVRNILSETCQKPFK